MSSRSWFDRLELDSVSGGTGKLTVPTRFLKSWIESHYLVPRARHVQSGSR